MRFIDRCTSSPPRSQILLRHSRASSLPCREQREAQVRQAEGLRRGPLISFGIEASQVGEVLTCELLGAPRPFVLLSRLARLKYIALIFYRRARVTSERHYSL